MEYFVSEMSDLPHHSHQSPERERFLNGDGAEIQHNQANNLDNYHSNRDSGIQDSDSTEPPANLEEKKQLQVVRDPIEDVAENWSRRASLISAQPPPGDPTLEINPADELCGWGPFSPQMCQRFRNPRWVLVWLSLAGVCQVSL